MAVPLPTTTVGALTARVRQECDIETDTPDDDYITDAEVLTYLNAANKRLVDHILDSGGGDLLVSANGPSTVAPGTSLNGVAYRVLGVDRFSNGSDANDGTTPYAKWTFETRHRYRDADNPAWRWFGAKLTWLPSEPTTPYRVWYVPVVADLDNTLDLVSTFNGWDDYVVAWASIKCLQKMDRDTSGQQMNLMDASARIASAVADFGPQSPDCIADVQTYDEDLWG